MKIRWLKWLIIVILIYFLLALKGYVGSLFSHEFKLNYSGNSIYIVISLAMGILVGVLLGLDNFIIEVQKKGKWKIDIPKAIILGVPSLFFSLTVLFSFQGFLKAVQPLYFFLKFDTTFISIFQVILGYTIATIFYRDKVN